jgi:hypothetical protein
LAVGDLDQDVPRAPLLRGLEPLALFLVGGAQLFLGDLDGRGDVGQRQLDVLKIDRLGSLVARLVALVACRDGGVVDGDVGRERVDVEQRVCHLAPLIVELDVTAKLGGRQERRVANAALQVADLEALALQFLERSGGQTRVRKLATIEVERELAFGAMERRDLADRLRQPLIRGTVALLLDALLDRRVANELLDDGAAQIAAHVLRQLGAIELLILVLTFLQRTIEIRERHVLAVDLRCEGRGTHQPKIDAPKNEAERNETEDDPDDPFGEGVVNSLQHPSEPQKN